FVPHFAEEMWERLGYEFSVFSQPWPECDEKALIKDEIEIAVQINGAVKCRLNVPSSSTQEEVREVVMNNPAVDGFIAGRNVMKFIYVPGRLANLVVK
ncbi:MAG: class I tRNA ligase family protein, partial [Eubacteriales bacterium]|nr:class I tRNA ligase family protein [Eubacteriales bacterium]